MINKGLTTIFGSKHERDVKRMLPMVAQINSLEPEVSKLSDDELRGKTTEFRERLRPVVEVLDATKKEVPRDDNAVKAAQTDLQEALDDLLPEAFAVCCEAAKRTLNMRHFDVQLMGGVVLHNGKISEMKTGEGKTLVATLPVYLNALTGRGVHVVTVNDYLAARDCEWMGAVYRFLGLTAGCIQHDQPPSVRREQYYCDITYGTNAEFGFDYLRDNGMLLYKVKLGQPKSSGLLKLLEDPEHLKLMNKAELELHADQTKKELYAQKEELLFAIDEKSHDADLTEQGRNFLSPQDPD